MNNIIKTVKEKGHKIEFYKGGKDKKYKAIIYDK
jgi:hypothetical protein